MQILISYGAYKDTGMLWLNLAPTHWHVKPNRTIWNERKVNNYMDEQLLSVTIKRGLIAQKELIASTAKRDSSNQDKSKYKLVKPNDIVYNKMRMWQGAVGVSKYQGIVSPAYIVLETNCAHNSKYYHYLLRTPNYIEESHRNSYGICDDQLSLRYEDFKRIYNIIPPKEEQDQIVRYLDSKLPKINKFIKNKKRLIELLKEQKQAVINQAVTKGLDHDAKMKPSGVEWLGAVPEGWVVVRLKNYSKVNPSINHLLKRYSLEDEVVFLPMAKISTYGDVDDTETRKIGEVRSGFTSFAKDDVVVAKITPCFENGKGACLNQIKTEIGFGTTELIVLRAYKNIQPEYLYYITRSDYFRCAGAEFMTGSAGQKRVPVDFIERFRIGVPSIDIQNTIVDYIEAHLKTIDQTIDRIKKEIVLITEYRTSLISAVVTGKVDVRGIAVEEPPAEDLSEPDLDDIEDEELREDDLLESEAI